MSDAERTVDTMAIFERRILGTHVLIMAWVAHVVCAEAVEDCHRAAVLAFPVNLCCSMLFTVGATGANLLQKAVLAN